MLSQASFAVGRQFGITSPAEGIRKLKQMERNSAIWAQPMLLVLHPDRVAVIDEQSVSFAEKTLKKSKKIKNQFNKRTKLYQIY
jgi:hypothetical protein